MPLVLADKPGECPDVTSQGRVVPLVPGCKSDFNCLETDKCCMGMCLVPDPCNFTCEPVWLTPTEDVTVECFLGDDDDDVSESSESDDDNVSESHESDDDDVSDSSEDGDEDSDSDSEEYEVYYAQIDVDDSSDEEETVDNDEKEVNDTQVDVNTRNDSDDTDSEENYKKAETGEENFDDNYMPYSKWERKKWHKQQKKERKDKKNAGKEEKQKVKQELKYQKNTMKVQRKAEKFAEKLDKWLATGREDKLIKWRTKLEKKAEKKYEKAKGKQNKDRGNPKHKVNELWEKREERIARLLSMSQEERNAYWGDHFGHENGFWSRMDQPEVPENLESQETDDRNYSKDRNGYWKNKFDRKKDKKEKKRNKVQRRWKGRKWQ
ncbi:hypothetical protein MAR_004910 [Mya arenaria]|uniref:WAP domain-containing protein n=1 Tax=Mya arenaria TaxID=6604 RepID=A0ABY7EY45_MYAAR|nr:hypothetical protein MAR_004910 [Mya arenaria]